MVKGRMMGYGLPLTGKLENVDLCGIGMPMKPNNRSKANE
jgi:hypothetical protein